MNPWKEETKDEREAKARETVKSFRDFMARTRCPHPEEMLLPYKRIIPQFALDTHGHFHELEGKEIYLDAIKRAVDRELDWLHAEKLATYNKIVLKHGEWLESLEKGAGYIEKRLDIGHYFDETGTEDDLSKALRTASDCLDGVGGVTYEGVGALLYSKPVYYVYFTVDGIDAEFSIVVPNIHVNDFRYPLEPNLRITCHPFGGDTEEIASGECPSELARSFISALEDKKLLGMIVWFASRDKSNREKYFLDNWRIKRQAIIAPIAKNLN